jgi:hypothetical protein
MRSEDSIGQANIGDITPYRVVQGVKNGRWP